VPGRELLRRAHVEDDDLPGPGALHQLRAADWLKRVPGQKVVADHLADLGRPRPGQIPHRHDERGDIIAGQPVEHLRACLRPVIRPDLASTCR
jgi:hypothetical protein